jgi:excinuclease ABC subunit B
VEHGFRIPCALDNRPLRFSEFESLNDSVIFASATPADYELAKCRGVIVEQVIRPTGLVDPVMEIKPAQNQIDDLIERLRSVAEKKQRALVTTLTKKTAEDLAEYLTTLDFRVRYLHSEIETLERSDIIRDLRLGEFDILIGINLLREGLDLPEVSLVAILDADKEGFLRSARSLIQISGRAARHSEGKIILYADIITDSIKKAVDESLRRRVKQIDYNRMHGITPKTIERKIQDRFSSFMEGEKVEPPRATEGSVREAAREYGAVPDTDRPARGGDVKRLIIKLEKEMRDAASRLEFEKAARLRDRIEEIRRMP